MLVNLQLSTGSNEVTCTQLQHRLDDSDLSRVVFQIGLLFALVWLQQSESPRWPNMGTTSCKTMACIQLSWVIRRSVFFALQLFICTMH